VCSDSLTAAPAANLSNRGMPRTWSRRTGFRAGTNAMVTERLQFAPCSKDRSSARKTIRAVGGPLASESMSEPF